MCLIHNHELNLTLQTYVTSQIQGFIFYHMPNPWPRAKPYLSNLCYQLNSKPSLVESTLNVSEQKVEPRPLYQPYIERNLSIPQTLQTTSQIAPNSKHMCYVKCQNQARSSSQVSI